MRVLFSSKRGVKFSCDNFKAHSLKSNPRHTLRKRSYRCRALFGPSDDSSGYIPDSIPTIFPDSDWRKFRARLVASYPSDEDTPLEWAHPIPTPELGCILVAHPLMFVHQQAYFNLAIIFIFVHDHTGTAGLILNKPTRYTLGELDSTRNVATGFEENLLYLGGDVGDNTLHLLHGYGDLDDSVEVIEGVYINGYPAARSDVLRGMKNPSGFKWLAKYCGWRPGQLEEECKSGVWFPAACSSSLIVKEQSLMDQPADLWHQVMQLMGGEHKELSDIIISSYDKTTGTP